MNPFISIIIPCLNEERYIGKCLTSIVENDYPKNKLELLVVDGGSEDKTREIINEFTKKYSFIRLLDNPNKLQGFALNIGIKNAKGEIIMRMDTHTTYPAEYISKCIKYLLSSGADNVGGIWVTLPGDNTFIAKSIAIGMASRFGVGNAYFRIGNKTPKFVDTVPFGCYRKEVFTKIGLFDNGISPVEDDEFNYRLRKLGGKILLVPEIVSYYHARTSLKLLWKQYFRYGFWKVRVFQKHPRMMQPRQFIPVIFVSGLLFSLIVGIFLGPFLWLFFAIVVCYLIGALFFSFKIAREKRWKYFWVMPVVFAVLHISYGTGFLTGLMRIAKK